MLKVRITYADDSEKEKFIDRVSDTFKILQVSKVYEGRGNSIYKNVYLDVEVK